MVFFLLAFRSAAVSWFKHSVSGAWDKGLEFYLGFES